jgi:hypothetical protein
LFWKKSTKKDAGSEKLFSTPTEGRGSFRVAPQRETPLKATLSGVPILILNISSGGFSFEKITLKQEKFYLAEILLPQENSKISALVKLLDNDGENYYRCQFVDLPHEIENLIHRYVMNRQKEEKEEQEIANRLNS